MEKFRIAMIADGLKQKTADWYGWLLSESPANAVTWLYRRNIYELKDVKTDDLREYIVELRTTRNSRTGNLLSQHTIDDYLQALHRFFSWCADEFERANPMKRIAYPKRQANEEPKAVALEDVSKMLATCGDDPIGIRNRAILLFLLDTGCRAGGLCGLKTSDVEVTKKRAIVTEKGNRTRVLLYVDRTRDALQQWVDLRSPVQPFFYNVETLEALTVGGLRAILRNIARRAKVTGRVNPHSFRHAFAREYIRNGGDLASLSKRMGHRQSSTTIESYIIFTEQEIAELQERYSPVNSLK